MRRVVLFPLALAVACSDAATELPDDRDAGVARDAGETTRDAGVRDAGSVVRDGGSTPRDGGRFDAALPDGSLAGTNLNGLAVTWREDLELCETWAESRTIDQALDRKVRVRLPAQARPSLEPADLGAAELRANVARSPFAAGRHRADPAASTLTDWRLEGPSSDTILIAEIAHDLGDGGTLFEQLYVRRGVGDTSPVEYGGDDVTFSYQPPAAKRAPLGRCGGAEELDDAVYVFHATSANDWITLLRQQRTRPTVAGSAPMYPTRAEIVSSQNPGFVEPVSATGHFTQVYTAGHHNWNEHSLIRFDHDRRWSFLVFERIARGEPPHGLGWLPSLVRLNPVNVPGTTGQIDVTTLIDTNGNETTTTYDVQVDSVRVDDWAVAGGLNCPASVRTQWGLSTAGNYLFQVVSCMGTPVVLVPVYLPQAPGLAGQHFTNPTPEPVNGNAAWAFDLGDVTVVIGEDDLVLRNPQGVELDDPLTFEAPFFEAYRSVGQPPQILEHHTSSGDVRAKLERLWVAQGVGNSGIYAPMSFTLEFDGETYVVEAWDQLDYTNTHHNWDDSLVATTDEVVLRWSVSGFGGPPTVSAYRRSDGAALLPPTRLE